MQNISNLCHEFAHAYDAQQSKTKDENLTTILERIKPPLTKMFDLSLITFDTSTIQKIYELRDDEIFARALNQHYLRTRGDNVFANPIKPQISDYVIDYIYMNDEEFRNQINEYFMSIQEIAKWGKPEIKPVIQSKFVSDEDYEHLISELNQLTELNKQLEL